MKRKLSVTIEEELLLMIDERTRSSIYRNKSHLVELALKKYLKEKNV